MAGWMVLGYGVPMNKTVVKAIVRRVMGSPMSDAFNALVLYWDSGPMKK